MSTEVTYKGTTLSTLTNQTKVLKTAGKYMEDDVTITDESSGGSAVVVTEETDTGGGIIKHITAIDLSNDTVDAAHLLSGYTAHDFQGNAVTGTYEGGTVPTGTINIITNGTHDVTGYATANVNVPTGSTINNQNKTVSPTESQQTVTADSGYTGLGTVTVNAISSTYVGSEVARKSSTDLTSSGATVTVPAGYYEESASKSVAAGTAGTPTASKGTVSNHSISVTPSVTNTTGYISGGTVNGTAVTVSASELVSGSETKTANGTYDVTNLSSLVVSIPLQTVYTGSSVPSSSTGSNGDIYIQS